MKEGESGEGHLPTDAGLPKELARAKQWPSLSPSVLAAGAAWRRGETCPYSRRSGCGAIAVRPGTLL